MTPRSRVFTRMWAVAVLAHLAGNSFYGDIWPDLTLVGSVLGALGLAATAVIVMPTRSLLLVLTALVPIGVIVEMPVVGNHWLLAGFVSLAYFLSWGRWERFEPAARLILLVAYGFAAFSKLNTGFLDPATSCAVTYANLAGSELGFAAIRAQSVVGYAVAWGSALVELSIPVLLLARRTRPFGVVVALIFHGLLSLHPGQHFYDFTGVLLPLFVLFLDDGFAERFERVGEALRPGIQSLLRLVVFGVGVAITVANVTPLNPTTFWFLDTFSFVWWIPYLLFVAWAVVGSMRPTVLTWRLAPVGIVLVALVAANGLMPYLELKTATAWNMYSNLVTVDGESNHLVVRATLPLRDGHADLVRVVSSPDPGLQVYADQGYLLPWPSFLVYLADHPGTEVVYERAGERHEVAATDAAAPVPAWWRVMPLRAVHGEQPDRCQIGFLPAL